MRELNYFVDGGALSDLLENTSVSYSLLSELVNFLTEEAEVEKIIKAYVGNGEVKLPSIFSHEKLILEGAIYTPHRNFLVFGDNGQRVAIVQHHKFARAIYVIDQDVLIGLDAHSIGYSSVNCFLDELARLDVIGKINVRSKSPSRSIFVGYDRPYHYFYDTLPQFLKYIACMDEEVGLVTIRSYNFFDVSSLGESLGGMVEFEDYQSLNNYLWSHNHLLMLPGYVQRDFGLVFTKDEIIKKASGQLISDPKKETINKRFEDVDVSVWFGVCAEKRAWFEQLEGVRKIIQLLKSRFPKVLFVFDGITDVVSSNNSDIFGHVQREKEIVDKICFGLVESDQRLDLIGEKSWTKIYCAQKCSYFISSFLTDSLYPARFAELLGLAHGANRAMTSDHIHSKTLFVPKSEVKDFVFDENENWSKISYSMSPDFVCSYFSKILEARDYRLHLARLGSKSDGSYIKSFVKGEEFSLEYEGDEHAYFRVNGDFSSFEALGDGSILVSGSGKYVVNFSYKTIVGSGVSLHVLLCKDGRRVSNHVINPGSSALVNVPDENCYLNIYFRCKGLVKINDSSISLVNIKGDLYSYCDSLIGGKLESYSMSRWMSSHGKKRSLSLVQSLIRFGFAKTIFVWNKVAGLFKPSLADGNVLDSPRVIAKELNKVQLGQLNDLKELEGKVSNREGIYDFCFVNMGVKVYFRFVNRNSTRLVVFFNAAVSRTKSTKFPIFSGNNAVSKIDSNILMIDDPALNDDNDVSLGWYAGLDRVNFQEYLAAMLKTFVDVFGCQATVFYGGSGGGFAAIKYGELVEGVDIVCANPQTDILKYDRGSVLRYVTSSFGLEFSESLSAKLKDRGVEHRVEISSIPDSNRLLYLQNMHDNHHVQNHFIPFFSKFSLEEFPINRCVEVSDRKFALLSDQWGVGHRAPPKDFVFSLINEVLCNRSSVNLKDLVEDLNFQFSVLISSATVNYENGTIKVQVQVNDSYISSGVKFAYYLMKDGVRIAYATYSESSFYDFNVKEAGQYRVICFAKVGSKSDSVKSKKVLISD